MKSAWAKPAVKRCATCRSALDVSDVTSFIAAVIQAEQLGVSIAKVLRIQSDQMRVRRRQRAEEKAHQAPGEDVVPDGLLDLPGDLGGAARAGYLAGDGD